MLSQGYCTKAKEGRVLHHQTSASADARPVPQTRSDAPVQRFEFPPIQWKQLPTSSNHEGRQRKVLVQIISQTSYPVGPGQVCGGIN